MIPEICKDCHHICTSHTECLKLQEFNIIVDDARTIAKLKKNIKYAVPHFKGLKNWLREENHHYTATPFDSTTQYKHRFMTITFDPKKFSYNELTQPILLHNYVLNALWDLKDLFDGGILLVREYHKTGVPHYHLNYSCKTMLEHATLKLRMQYFFADSLRNRKCIQDRHFNEYGQMYIRKCNETYLKFKNNYIIV